MRKLCFSSFHLCRSKKDDAVHPAAAYRINNNHPKLPAPPPSTPNLEAGSNRRLNQSGSLLINLDLLASDYSSDSFEFSSKNEIDAKWQARTNNYGNRIYLDSCDFGPAIVDPEPKIKVKQNNALVIPCYDDDDHDEEDPAESLLYSSRSFDSSSYDFSHAVAESTASDSERSMAAAQRLKEMIRRQAQNDQSYKSSMGEAMAVVKKSSNPKEDFKRSMLEMISEREIYDGKELEELLQCLLSLNSRQYHSDIVEAFSDIWKVLFL